MKLTMRDIRIIGESRYWHKVSNKLFIFLVSALGWALLCVLATYLMGMVKPTLATFTINPRILASAQVMTQTQNVPVTIEGQNVYLGDIRLPKEDPPPKDFTIPFILISMAPLTCFMGYFSYHAFKAGEAGTTLIEEWIRDGVTVIS